ncbi:hypothetical protein P5673_007378 [Acropora cervicornis]|uniref:Tectonic-1-3 domain-containing protein n=1 Tax=Acropora cervicornis TaxID=6130 RepID=A0AAD9QVK8_ACRCE|nr:hypothetical protein P5673_007378 [Acropora cervicornis]
MAVNLVLWYSGFLLFASFSVLTRAQSNGTEFFPSSSTDESRNLYKNVQTASTEGQFSTLKSQLTSVVYDYLHEMPDTAPSSSFYTVGDPVLLVFDNGARGFLSLPKPLFGSECDDNNPAGYREDNSTECTRTITVLESECERSPNPSVLDTNSSSSTNSSNSSIVMSDLLDVMVKEPLLCNTSLGIPNACPFTVPPDPTYDAVNKRCDNVVLEVGFSS